MINSTPQSQRALVVIKAIHTAIWLFFNGVLAYLIHAVLVDRIDQGVWIGLGLFGVECLVLVVFRMSCPLTVMARRYSASTKPNFDIYLPEWLARHNQVIYGSLL